MKTMTDEPSQQAPYAYIHVHNQFSIHMDSKVSNGTSISGIDLSLCPLYKLTIMQLSMSFSCPLPLTVRQRQGRI